MTIAATELKESELRHWRLLDQFRLRLKRLPVPVSSLTGESRRKLLENDYFCLLLFGLFNPALKSMRALCHASERFEKMRQVCSTPVKPTCFSEAQHVFDPPILADILRQLAQEAKGRGDFGDERLRQAIECLTAVDGTVLRAINRMTWASVGKHGSAIKLHTHFSVFDQIPVDWTITPANVCERKTLKGKAQPGSFYVADRLYSDDYAFLGKLVRQGSDFVFRLPPSAVRTPAGPASPLTPEDQAAGVVSDRLEEIGAVYNGPPLRVVEVHAAGKIIVLVTSRRDLPAELIGLIYRYRWQIELFFKWLKTILGCAHWMAESERGVAIQLYSALIASLLLMLSTGRRPTKRQMEAISLYFTGFVTEAELLRELNFQKS